MDEVLKRDQNHVTVLAGVTDDADQDIMMLRVDPVTKRLLVKSTGGGSSGLIVGTTTITGATNGDLLYNNNGVLGSIAPSGTGTVTSVSVVTANGFAGSVANATTTPAITLTTSITGILQGNGTAISAITIGTGLDFSGGTLSVTGGGTGDVVGPASATDNAIARFDGATGKLIQNSAVTIADTSGNMAGVGTLNTHTIPGGTSTFAILTNKLSAFAATSSAELATVISDETGSGLLVFATSPTLTTPVLGVASATSINKMAITAPATSSTLAVADGKTFTASNTITLSGTDGVSMNITNSKLRYIGFSAVTPSTGQQGSYVIVPFSGTITGYKIAVDAGTCTVKTWKVASGTASPTIANVISTSGVSLSSNTMIISSTTSDFTTTTVSANDAFAFDLTAVSGVGKLLFELEITIN